MNMRTARLGYQHDCTSNVTLLIWMFLCLQLVTRPGSIASTETQTDVNMNDLDADGWVLIYSSITWKNLYSNQREICSYIRYLFYVFILWAEWPRIQSKSPSRVNYFLNVVQTGSEADPSFCPMRTGREGCFLGGKAAEPWRWPLTSNECGCQGNVDLYIHFHRRLNSSYFIS